MTRTLYLISLATTLMAATTLPAQRPPIPQLKDSAGVSILQYDLTSRSTAIPKLTFGQSVRLGQGAADTLFDDPTRIQGGLLLDGRRALVLLRSSQTIVLLNTRDVVRSIGRRGSGPAEFRRAQGPWLTREGHVVVYDAQLRRTTLFDTTGRSIRSSTHADRSAADSAVSLSGAEGALANGSVVARGQLASTTKVGLLRDRIQLIVLNDADNRRTVGPAFAGDERYIAPPNRQGFAALGVSPFARKPLVGVCADAVVLTDSERLQLQEYSASGILRRVVRIAVPTIVIQRSHYEQAIREQSKGRVAPTREMVAELERMTPHRTLPVATSVRCMRDGSLWVERFAVPGSKDRELLVFASDRSLLGALQLSRDHVLLDAYNGELLIARPGSDDVAIVEIVKLLGVRR